MNGTKATKRVEQTNGYLWADFPKSRYSLYRLFTRSPSGGSNATFLTTPLAQQ